VPICKVEHIKDVVLSSRFRNKKRQKKTYKNIYDIDLKEALAIIMG